MKRALAMVLVLAAFLPAAMLLAAAFDCGMPCCHQGSQSARFVPDCCQPVMTSESQPAPLAKSTTVATKRALAVEVTAVAASLLRSERFETRESSPPRPVRVRLATLATLLI